MRQSVFMISDEVDKQVNHNRRKQLIAVCVLLSSIVFLFFAYVFWQGLSNASSEIGLSKKGTDTLSEIRQGETKRLRYQGKVYWVTHFSHHQVRELNRFSHTQIMVNAGCQLSGFCVVQAKTKQSAIELVFTQKRPKNLPSDSPWLGGFVNPVTLTVYDLAARPYLFAPYFSNPGQSDDTVEELITLDQALF